MRIRDTKTEAEPVAAGQGVVAGERPTAGRPLPATVPVLVAGAGPVGLATAMFLAQRGVAVLVVDKRNPFTGPPRALSSIRTLELLRAAGLQKAVERTGWYGPEPFQAVFTDSALGGARQHVAPPEPYVRWLRNCSPVDSRLVLNHLQVQRLASDELLRRGGDLRLGIAVTGLEQDADADSYVESGPVSGGVRVRLADTATGEEYGITARYVIGADGAHSTVRRLLGLTVPDREVVARLHTAFYRADLPTGAAGLRDTACFVRNTDVYATVFCVNGRDQWVSHLMDYPGRPDDTDGIAPLPTDRALALLRSAVGDPGLSVELMAVNAWEAAVGVASAFRRGRVFLAGDSAHVQSSAGGLGMNTGVQDGHNLAWKLAAVLRGQAAERLLDTYEPERRAAVRASLALSRTMHRGYRSLGGGDPNALYELAAGDYIRAMMRYAYPSGAVVPPDTAPAPDLLADHVHPGHRLPHRPLKTPENGRTSTLDLAGADWALFAGSHGAPWRPAATEAAAALGITLSTHRVPDGTLPGLASDGAVLVRPDHFVAWRADRLAADPGTAVKRTLAALLGPLPGT
ncbi:FAD-dependent oxidoreductase [Streptomyces chrestomyceticus JCM 4735]|uniref:FAD-dependent oxidoreductase n=1 Tax=Streptomyces chrestomyceticus JCM 4735 TaxID=1306181 RepID=A0A7U9PWL7_9ACTN|nr:FAD-dependent monooxygenase [Streptomyces chrestomyceticus]GCD33680.1 FAD-dependent oxidoreductase [Streptomyces chrestomyceticus JCM 4735]